MYLHDFILNGLCGFNKSISFDRVLPESTILSIIKTF